MAMSTKENFVKKWCLKFHLDKTSSVTRGFREFKIVREKPSDNLKSLMKAVSTISTSTCENGILVHYDSKTMLINILTVVNLLFVNFVGPPMNQSQLTKYVKP